MPMQLSARTAYHLFGAETTNVSPGEFLIWLISQSSVRNGEVGRLALLYRLPTGLLAKAYRTETGCETFSLLATTVSPTISALATWYTLSAPAIAKPLSG